MVLQCKCGSLELAYVKQDYSDGGDFDYERYECEDCGRRGTYKFGTRNGGQHVERMSGCLTTTEDY